MSSLDKSLSRQAISSVYSPFQYVYRSVITIELFSLHISILVELFYVICLVALHKHILGEWVCN